jgi:hypothetical protein
MQFDQHVFELAFGVRAVVALTLKTIDSVALLLEFCRSVSSRSLGS